MTANAARMHRRRAARRVERALLGLLEVWGPSYLRVQGVTAAHLAHEANIPVAEAHAGLFYLRHRRVVVMLDQAGDVWALHSDYAATSCGRSS